VGVNGKRCVLGSSVEFNSGLSVRVPFSLPYEEQEEEAEEVSHRLTGRELREGLICVRREREQTWREVTVQLLSKLMGFERWWRAAG
jgi:hypothetical protein